MNKKIVVVTPVKDLILNNKTSEFERLIDSIQAQVYDNIIHLLIAGQSSDGTNVYLEEYAEKFHNVQISYQETKNKWHAMNLGLEIAQGDYIMFLEDDQFFTTPKAISTMVDKIEKEDASFTFGPVWEQPDFGNKTLKKVYLILFFRRAPFELASMLCNMSFAKEKLYFDDEMKYMANVGFILRALLSGEKGAEIEKALACVSLHAKTELDIEKMNAISKEEMIQQDEQFFLGIGGMTRQALKGAVEEGRISQSFLDEVTMLTHPFFKECIQKVVWDQMHKFDKFDYYIKEGYDKIYIPLNGIGDALLFAPIARKIFEQTGKKVLVGHKNKELFENNPYIEAIDSVYDSPEKMGIEDIDFLKKIGFDIQYVTYWKSYLVKNNPETYFFAYPSEHLIARMYAVCGCSGKIEIKPEIYLSEEEKLFGRFVSKERKQIVIMSSALAPWKEYPFFQQIIDVLKDEYDFIQVGAAEDKILKNTKENLAGKITLRQTASVLYNSDLFVGEIGGLMHMARAVDCPAVIAYSSAEPNFADSYVANINVGPKEKCLLGQKNGCDTCNPCSNRKNPYCCCRTISVEKMIAGIRKQLQKGKGKMPVEIVEVKADPFDNSVEEYLRRCFK